jgi:hypothetical protein
MSAGELSSEVEVWSAEEPLSEVEEVEEAW